MRLAVVGALLLACLAVTETARAVGDPGVAALQVALRAHGVYRGPVDGLRGPATTAAVKQLQRRARLVADGVVGPRTRAALGRRYGRPRLGSRLLKHGAAGWDVAALQFLLAWHGFPSGKFDGKLGPRTARALRRYQRWAGLSVDGIAGPATLAALRAPPPRSPLKVRWPVEGSLGDVFGPRGARFHAGVDIAADAGAAIAAAAAGEVVFAGWRGAFGKLVTVAHGGGVRTMYAHLSEIAVRVGQRVAAGGHVGLVGATGRATGPHLHFEVRVRGAAVDPLTALG